MSISFERLKEQLEKAKSLLLSQQYEEGFWWYTLEANESIGAEFIFLLHYLGIQERYSEIQEGLIRRLVGQQTEEGAWTLFSGGPGDLSTTVECYLAIRLAGRGMDDPVLVKARKFILSRGGVLKSRVFTKIHLALFGWLPWDSCPDMPVSFIQFPTSLPFNIYEFSSWARACIVPLLIVLQKKKTVKVSIENIEELFTEPLEGRNYRFQSSHPPLSLENFFVQSDRFLKFWNRSIMPNKQSLKSLKKAEEWIVSHVEKTEDIFPALAYAIFALTALEYPFSHSVIQKCFNALLSFQQLSGEKLAPLPTPAHSDLFSPQKEWKVSSEEAISIHQQCCVSPVWDTPWVAVALLEAGLQPDHPALQKSARWLMTKQIRETYGDWSIKNKKGAPGGWSFEFQNDYFPDVDDTVEVLQFLMRVDLPSAEIRPVFERGLQWLLSMQSANGGWGAFDVDNVQEWVNKIPFSDHGACLDPPTPDITGRILELLSQLGFRRTDPVCRRAIDFILKQQEANGSWWGRWGVNYIYGTWSVLQGLIGIGFSVDEPEIVRAAAWLKSIQNSDGGWSESCESYNRGLHVPLSSSTASQTAWAVMGLIAAGEIASESVEKGIEFLLHQQNEKGGWEENAYTGTGFPGHFYIQYHGYQYYFPLLALGKYMNAVMAD